jgi:hypothetical protein
MKKLILAFSAITLVPSAFAQLTITKDPDIGDYWHPLGAAPNQTPLYMDTFVAPTSGSYNLTSIGIWLDSTNTAGAELTFKLFDSLNNGTPNTSAILTTSAAQTFVTTGLTLETLAVTPFALTAGHMYFVGASSTGNGNGWYYVGGHTQNSEGINDNGAFWYTNDPAQLSGLSGALTPEMAYQVKLQSVPEPVSMIALGTGIVALLRKRSK